MYSLCFSGISPTDLCDAIGTRGGSILYLQIRISHGLLCHLGHFVRIESSRKMLTMPMLHETHVVMIWKGS